MTGRSSDLASLSEVRLQISEVSFKSVFCHLCSVIWLSTSGLPVQQKKPFDYAQGSPRLTRTVTYRVRSCRQRRHRGIKKVNGGW